MVNDIVVNAVEKVLPSYCYLWPLITYLIFFADGIFLKRGYREGVNKTKGIFIVFSLTYKRFLEKCNTLKLCSIHPL